MKRKTLKKNLKIKTIMPMLPNQKKMTPDKMILSLTYLDMLAHTQPQNIQQINEKQREILKPFIKKNKNKNKTSKIQRGGHVFYYNVLPEICGIDVHNSDCVPSTLYFLGLLTHEAATYLATHRRYGVHMDSIVEWLDESFPDEINHVDDKIIDLRDVYIRTNRRGKNIYDRRRINAENPRIMGYLHYVLPYNQMGVIATCEYFDDYNQFDGGHTFCIVKNEYGQLVLIDPQSRYSRIIRDLYDIIYYLDYMGAGYAYTMHIYVQAGTYDAYWGYEQQYGENEFEVANTNRLNANRLLELNRERLENGTNEEDEYDEEAEYNVEQGNSPEQFRFPNQTPVREASRPPARRANPAEAQTRSAVYPPPPTKPPVRHHSETGPGMFFDDQGYLHRINGNYHTYEDGTRHYDPAYNNRNELG
jgi:hypothetical protein